MASDYRDWGKERRQAMEQRQRKQALLVYALLTFLGAATFTAAINVSYSLGKAEGRRQMVSQYEAQIAYLKSAVNPEAIKQWLKQ